MLCDNKDSISVLATKEFYISWLSLNLHGTVCLVVANRMWEDVMSPVPSLVTEMPKEVLILSLLALLNAESHQRPQR